MPSRNCIIFADTYFAYYLNRVRNSKRKNKQLPQKHTVQQIKRLRVVLNSDLLYMYLLRNISKKNPECIYTVFQKYTFNEIGSFLIRCYLFKNVIHIYNMALRVINIHKYLPRGNGKVMECYVARCRQLNTKGFCFMVWFCFYQISVSQMSTLDFL